MCVVTDTTKAAPNIEKLPHLTLVTQRKSFHLHWGYQRNIAKGKTTQGLKVIAFESYRKFIKIQLRNLDQIYGQKLNQMSASKS